MTEISLHRLREQGGLAKPAGLPSSLPRIGTSLAQGFAFWNISSQAAIRASGNVFDALHSSRVFPQ